MNNPQSKMEWYKCHDNDPEVKIKIQYGEDFVTDNRFITIWAEDREICFNLSDLDFILDCLNKIKEEQLGE